MPKDIKFVRWYLGMLLLNQCGNKDSPGAKCSESDRPDGPLSAIMQDSHAYTISIYASTTTQDSLTDATPVLQRIISQ